MKKINFIIILFATTNLIVSCQSSSNQNSEKNNSKIIEKANWLIGVWENKSPEGIATEIWVKQNDTAYYGTSYFVIGKDTVSSETISLTQVGKDLFYIPTVKNQNNGKAVKFTLTTLSDNQLVFENPKHDFPQKISYKKISNDSLVAEISGILNGKQNSQLFPMKKMK
jgi:sarcosine oxidase delta subunit